MPVERILLRPGEVAEAIGMSRSRVYELIASGEIPSVKIGNVRRVPVDMLREWVARNVDAQAESRQHGA